MALIKCKECNKEISDQAVSCPSCGAPVKNAIDLPVKEKKKTSKMTWAVLALIALGVFVIYPQSRANKEQSLPVLPIDVTFRNALLGPGMVLQVKNKSNQILTTVVTLGSKTTQQVKSFRLDIDPHNISELGHKEGWILAHGDTLKIYNEQFQTWNGAIP